MLTPHDPEHQILYGLIAYQSGFIARSALIDALNDWKNDKTRLVSQILLNNKEIISRTDHAITVFVNILLDIHNGDATSCLKSLFPIDSILRHFQSLHDPDLQRVLKYVGADVTHDTMIGTAATSKSPQSQESRFQVISEHARGGQGLISIAKDTQLERKVALKTIQEEFADNLSTRGRFIQEAQITGGLMHPGIVPVYALETDHKGRPSYAMRFIDSPDFKTTIDLFYKEKTHDQIWDRHLIDMKQLLRHFINASNTVAYAHDRGVLHRDIKPRNIMVGKFNETLVLDWGLTKVVGRPEGSELFEEVTLRPQIVGELEDTPEHLARGTPAYMSPEQATARPEQYKPQSDIYSLGATLYYLLTGKSAFKLLERNDWPRVKDQILRGDFAQPRKLNSRIPLGLECICLKAMALKPDERYDSAKLLADDIESWLADERISAWGKKSEPPSEIAGRWARKHRAKAMSGVAVMVMAIFSLFVIAIVQVNANREQIIANAKIAGLAALSVDTLAQSSRLIVNDNPNLADAIPVDIRTQYINDILPRCEQLSQLQANDPTTRMAIAEALMMSARLQRSLGDRSHLDSASRYLTRAESIYAEMSQIPNARLGQAMSLSAQGAILGQRNQTEDAVVKLKQSLTLLNGQFDPTLQKDSTFLRILTLNNLANCENNLGKQSAQIASQNGPDKGEQDAAKTLAASQFAAADANYKSALGVLHAFNFKEERFIEWESRINGNLGLLHLERDANPTLILDEVGKAVTLAESITQSPAPTLAARDALVSALINRGDARRKFKDIGNNRQMALSDYQRASTGYDELNVRYPLILDFEWGQALARKSLAEILFEINDVEAAKRNLIDAKQRYDKLIGKTDLDAIKLEHKQVLQLQSKLEKR